MENMENKENLENNLENNSENNLEAEAENSFGEKEPKIINTDKEPRKITLWTAAVALLLAVLITFMTTFALLDAKYKAEQNAFVEAVTGDYYFPLEYVKALFDEYYLGDLSGLTDDEIMDALIKMYVMQTGDDYAYYWNEEEYSDYIKEMNGEGVGVGILVNYLEDKGAINVLFVHPNSPAEEAGLEPGDLIVSVGGESVAELGYDNAVGKVRGDEGTQITLGVVKNDGTSVTLTATRRQFTTVSVISKMLSDNKTGYIRLLQFDGTTTDQFAKAYIELKNQGAEHFIFDVRDNPGGALDSVMGVLSFLVGDGVPLIEISDKQGNSYTENSSRETYCGGKYINAEKHSGKTVVLTNGNTASAGELFTACMHSYSNDVITVGMKTYGKGVMQRNFPLPNGGVVKLTYRWYTAPGVENYNGKGLLPDVQQALSEESAKKNLLSLTEVEDDQLQKALKVLYGETLD